MNAAIENVDTMASCELNNKIALVSPVTSEANLMLLLLLLHAMRLIEKLFPIISEIRTEHNDVDAH